MKILRFLAMGHGARRLAFISLIFGGVALVLLIVNVLLHAFVGAFTDLILLVTNIFAFKTNRLLEKYLGPR